MYRPITVDSKNIQKFVDGLSEWGEVISEFYCSEERPYSYVWGDKSWSVLKGFIEYISERHSIEQIKDVDYSKANQYYILNRNEFEGSLVSNYLKGGVYGTPCDSNDEARALAAKIIDEIYPEENDFFQAYKIRGEGWSSFHRFWGINWSYIVNDQLNNRWWLLSYGSDS